MSRKDVKITGYKLIEKEKVTHDANRFRFKIPEEIDFSFLPGDHVKIYPNPNNPLEFRPYTPTNTPEIKSYFELIIKHYPNGKVSSYMKDKAVGDLVAMSGPEKGGHFQEGMAKKVGMVAGGSGITPMISMIRFILQRRLDAKIYLLYANKSIDDIILKEELDNYSYEYNYFSLYYILDKAPDGWPMGVGHIDKDLMKDKLPGPADDTIIFVCGPPMMQINLRKQLIELGHSGEKVIFP